MSCKVNFMNRIISVALILTFFLSLTACQKDSENDGADDNDLSDETTSFAESDEDMFTDSDMNPSYNVNKSVLIKLSGDSATSSSNSVKISGGTVTLCDEGTYIISGTLSDGMIVVDAEKTDKLHLVFDGVNITSKTSAPLCIVKADKVFVTLAEGSENTLANDGGFSNTDDNNIDGTVFSKEDLTFNGNGTLSINSPSGHGIVCKDDLVFTGGTYSVNSASHGLDANDSIRLKNVSFSVTAGKDGFHVENDEDDSLGFVYISSGIYDISSEGDGISASAHMQIEDGTFDIISGGGSENASDKSSDSWGVMGGKKGMPGEMGVPGSIDPKGKESNQPNTMGNLEDSNISGTSENDDSSSSIKGIKALGSMRINSGKFNIDSADDAVHSNMSITVNGGDFNIATGDDGFHADESLAITGGKIKITESYEGLEALHLSITGGDITIVSDDDGINAAGGADSSGFGGERGGDIFRGIGGDPGKGGDGSSNGTILISGGNIDITAYGDGIDANGTLEISGGYITICGPTQGDTATLDFDVSGTISGGTFIGTGASGMAQTFSGGEQGVISRKVGNQAAGTKIVLKDSNGNTLIEKTPELSFEVVIISSPDIASGETYTLTVGKSNEKVTAD